MLVESKGRKDVTGGLVEINVLENAMEEDIGEMLSEVGRRRQVRLLVCFPRIFWYFCYSWQVWGVVGSLMHHAGSKDLEHFGVIF
jgi:hypothetical protein